MYSETCLSKIEFSPQSHRGHRDYSVLSVTLWWTILRLVNPGRLSEGVRSPVDWRCRCPDHSKDKTGGAEGKRVQPTREDAAGDDGNHQKDNEQSRGHGKANRREFFFRL
jgi:hypothetical protein